MEWEDVVRNKPLKTGSYTAYDYGTHLVKGTSQRIVPRGTQIPKGRTTQKKRKTQILTKIPHRTKKPASSLGNYQKLTYLAVQMKTILTQYK